MPHVRRRRRQATLAGRKWGARRRSRSPRLATLPSRRRTRRGPWHPLPEPARRGRRDTCHLVVSHPAIIPLAPGLPRENQQPTTARHSTSRVRSDQRCFCRPSDFGRSTSGDHTCQPCPFGHSYISSPPKESTTSAFADCRTNDARPPHGPHRGASLYLIPGVIIPCRSLHSRGTSPYGRSSRPSYGRAPLATPTPVRCTPDRASRACSSILPCPLTGCAARFPPVLPCVVGRE